MAKKILLLTLISLIIFLGYEKMLYAQEQRLKTPNPASQDVRDKTNVEKVGPKIKPFEIKPLQTDIKNLTELVTFDRKFWIDKMKESLENFRKSREFANKLPGIVGYIYGTHEHNLINNYQYASHYCLNRAYSIQDQQAAGCVGSDTVSQCADKLYFWCMNQKYEPFKHLTELLLEMHNMLYLLNEHIKNIQDVSNKLNNKQY